MVMMERHSMAPVGNVIDSFVCIAHNFVPDKKDPVIIAIAMMLGGMVF